MTKKSDATGELNDSDFDAARGGWGIGVFMNVDEVQSEVVARPSAPRGVETIGARDSDTHAADDVVPVDTFSLNFGKIDVAP